MLFGADDQGAAGGFDDFEGDCPESVDLHDAFDLGEKSVYEAEVAAGDASDGGDGLGVGEALSGCWVSSVMSRVGAEGGLRGVWVRRR